MPSKPWTEQKKINELKDIPEGSGFPEKEKKWRGRYAGRDG